MRNHGLFMGSLTEDAPVPTPSTDSQAPVETPAPVPSNPSDLDGV